MQIAIYISTDMSKPEGIYMFIKTSAAFNNKK